METSPRKSFGELIAGPDPVLVDFSAEWCGPCKMLKPILDEVKIHLGKKITIIKVDVDKNPVVSEKYQIRGVPTMILFKENKILWRQSGVMPSAELELILNRYI